MKELKEIEIDNISSEKENKKSNINSVNNINSKKKGNVITSSNTGIKNDLYDNNCYINVCIQSIYHFRLLKDNLLSTNKFSLFHNTPNLITQLVVLISSYNASLKNEIIDPAQFSDALDEYFKDKNEFQKNQQNDPIELLNVLLTFCHNYIVSGFKEIGFNDDDCHNKCFIHQLFYINLIEVSSCSNCKLKNQIQYDNNNFMFLININNIIDTSNIYFSKFENFKEKLIQCFNYGNKVCSKCKTNNYSINYICNYLGFYFIINLTWENKVVDLVTLLKILCMINSGFSTVELFKNNIKKKIMKFLGLILFSSHHYVNLCYNKTDNNFILYDDTKISKFPNWEKTIEFIIKNRYIPIAIFYETLNESYENKCQFNISKLFYIEQYNECVKRDESFNNNYKNQKQLIDNKLNDGEWICDNCNSINPANNMICKCGYKNEIIERLIIQDLKNQNNDNNKNYKINNLNINKENENSNSSNDDNPFSLHTKNEIFKGNNELSEILICKNEMLINENKINQMKRNWKCLICKTINDSDINKCNNCGRRNNGYNMNFWSCKICNFNKNPINMKKCQKCENENNIYPYITDKIIKKNEDNPKRNENEDTNKNIIN